MKNKNVLLSWLAISVLTCVTNSCKVIETADRHFEYLEYTKAIPKYNKALRKDSANAEAWAKLGDCYRMNNQTVQAEACYKMAVQNSHVQSVYKLYYSQMLINNGKYEEAHQWVEDYMKAEPADPRGIALDSGISHLAEFYNDKDKYKVERLSINTTEAEYGPVLYKDGIIFASSREGESWANRNHSWTGENYYSLYYAKGSEMKFETPVIFLKGVQTKYNNSSVCFSKKGDEMFLTRNNIDHKKVMSSHEKVVKLKLYTSVLKDGQWTDVNPFQYNSDEYSCAHPAISPDGTKFYFASDMPGSIGGMDIWYCTRTPEGWGQPKNLGPSVNTKGNELFPTIADDGVIYFSSNGREGMGGLDIYSTVEKDGNYTSPVNMGAPVNSPDDDLGLVWDEKTKIGYFSSNRDHNGANDDIFCLIQNTVRLTGLVYDRQTEKALDNSSVRIVEEDSTAVTKQTNEEGNFTASVYLNKNYLLITERPDYITDTLKLAAADMIVNGDSVYVKIPLDRRELLISLRGKIYNESSGSPVDSARVTLINLTNNDTMQVTTGADGLYAFTNLAPESRYKVVAETEYCIPNAVDTSTFGITESKTLKIDFGIYCLSDNLVLHNIYYDLDKYNIRPDAAKELDKLVILMVKYNHIKIELGSHTDCRASSAYNMTLSHNRAKSAVAYLVQHGVDRKRLTAQGYGESKLVNRCECEGERKVDCTEEEHQLNRRTEIRILSWNWSIASMQ